MKKGVLGIFLVLVSSLAFAAKPKEGEKLAKIQSFVYNAAAAPQSLDPAKIEGQPEGLFAHSLFETLVISDENDKIIPGVALSWESSPDYKTWTFHLRKDAKWSNGDPVTAHDFVYSWRRLVDPKTASPYSSHLVYMKLKNAQAVINGKLPKEKLGISAKDDYTLVLDLEDSVPFAPSLTELFILSPVPKKVVEKFGDAWSDPKNVVGNGPFILKSFTINKDAHFVKNPHYWDAKNVILDKLTLLQIPSETVAFTRYRSSDLDVGTFPLEVLDKVKREYPKELAVESALCTAFFELNHRRPPFNDPKVRKALSLALDRSVITDKILRAGQTPAFVFSPPSITASEAIKQPEWASWDSKKRYEEAKKLLLEAGYSKSKPLSFNMLYTTNESQKKLAIATASMWKKNLDGLVNVKLENQEWKVYLASRHLGSHDTVLAYWCSDYSEASSFLSVFLSDSIKNRGAFKSKDFDEALNKAYRVATEEQRAEQYAKAEQILYEQTALIPLYVFTTTELVKPYVRGYKPKPSRMYYFKDIYILER